MRARRLSLVLLIAACSSRSNEGGPPEVFDNGVAALREDDIRAALGAGSVELEFPLLKRSGALVTGRLSARLLDLTKRPELALGEGSADFTQSEERKTHALEIAGLPAFANRASAAGLVVAWSIALPEGELRGRTSLYAALGKLEVELRGATDIPAGGGVPFRVIARDPDTLSPRAMASVKGTLLVDGAEPRILLDGRTDDRGELLAMIALPEGVEAGQLRIDVSDGDASSWATAAVRAIGPESLALSTDKTIYKPGQTIHLRVLGLSSTDKSPLASQPVAIEVLDGKGNKIVKRSLSTDAYGVASAQIPTAAEVNEGVWTFRAALAGARAERKIPVARYNLPKLKVGVSVDRGFAVPGDRVSGVIDARYLFGSPVAGAQVLLDAKVGETLVTEQRLSTDADGRALFSIALPSGLGGAALEDGEARLSLEARVTDSAGQSEDGAQLLPLAPGPIVLKALPESGALVAGVENRVHVLVRDPAGRPLAAHLRATIDGATSEHEAGADGAVELRFTPSGSTAQLELLATDGAQRSARRSVRLEAPADGAVIVRSDKALYRAGDTARLELIATSGARRVHLDVYKGGAGVLSRAVDLDARGRATIELPITAAMRGLLVFDALALGAPGEVVRGSARALVDPEDRLDVSLETGRGTYAPGDEATVRVRVRDASGQPKVAVLGMTAVDEAVFALGGEPSDDLRGVFSLDARSLPAGLSPSQLLSSDERTVRYLFAGAPKAEVAGLEYNSIREELPAVRSAVEGRVRADLVAYLKAIAPSLVGEELDEDAMKDEVLPGARRLIDAFGQAYDAQLGASPQTLRLQSAGPDERLGSADDAAVELWVGWVSFGSVSAVDDDGQFRGGFDAAAEAAPGGVPPQAAGPPAPNADPGNGATSASPAKVRADFRETIYVNPTLITDASGQASVSFGLADSITTWRVTAHGSTRDGKLGSGRLAFRTFQSFFVDFDVPTTLTRGDELELPAIVYNYLDTPATVRVSLDRAAWLEILGPAEATVSLGPSEVRAVRFRVRALKAGTQLLTLRGEAGGVADALVREARVAPGGVKDEVSFSDKLNGTRAHTFSIPASAIEGGSRVVLTLTPGFASEAVSGTDALLQEPGGCFEQTTSSAWPNTLVTKYLDVTGQLTPELREKAIGLVTRGYQRLVTFESPTGGINWWGGGCQDAGNRILTSIMLWHLKDMEGIIETDPAFKQRLLTWLLSQQSADGSFAAGDALHAGNEVLGTSVARTTAFIAWALAHTGWADAAVERANNYLRSNLPDEADLYANALAANALGFADPNGAATSQLFSRLDAHKIEADGRVRWAAEQPSWTGASGEVASLETTGLIAYGLFKARAYPANAAGAMRFIVGNKDAVGTWYNTQATMNALRALLAAASPMGSEAEGTLTVKVNGEALAPIAITRAEGDVYRAIELGDRVHAGDNTVELTMQGTGEITYHLARRVHLPRASVATSPELALEVRYEGANLVMGQPVRTTVRATYNGQGRRDQVLVRVGLAPGFVPMQEDLDALASAGRFARVEQRPGEVVFYLMGMERGAPRDLSFRAIPSLAADVEAPASVAYVYYEPSIRTEVAPVRLVVAE